MQAKSETSNAPLAASAAVFVAFACCFLLASRYRFIDGDEGFYLLSSRLVLEHKRPYLDFFYTQSPLLPYVYGLWMKFFGLTWYAGRALAALLTAGVGLLVFQFVCRETRKLGAGVVAAALFASSTYVFAWFPIAKTYSLSMLFLFAAYVLVARSNATHRALGCAGLLFALSVDVRSYVAALMPVFLWWVWQHGEPRHRVARAGWFLAGFAIGLLPCLYLFLLAPDQFLFNNLGFHALRSSDGLIGNWRVKVYTIRAVLFGMEDNGVQFTTLSVAALIAMAASKARQGPALLAFVLAVTAGLVSILPTPPFVQYFCVCMPFLIVSAVCGVSRLLDRSTARFNAVLALAMLTYAATALPSFQRYFVTGQGVIGLKGAEDAPNWTLDRVTMVSQALDRVAAPGEQVATFWPGYVFASHAAAYPGYENFFGWLVADQLTSAQRDLYHSGSLMQIESDLQKHVPRIAVWGNPAPWALEYDKVLRNNNYEPHPVAGVASIYVCCAAR